MHFKYVVNECSYRRNVLNVTVYDKSLFNIYGSSRTDLDLAVTFNALNNSSVISNESIYLSTFLY